MLPESEEEVAEQAKLDVELHLNPPSADQLQTYQSLIPHPQPWNVHNAAMLRECLTSMGLSLAEVNKLKVKVRAHLTHLSGQLLLGISTHATCVLVLTLILFASAFDSSFAQVFLNRILGLPVQKQNALFEYFVQVLNFSVLQAKKEGTYSEAVSDLSAEHITVRSRHTLPELLRETSAQVKAKGIDKKKKLKNDSVEYKMAESDESEMSDAAPAAAAADPSAGEDGDKTFIWELSLDRGISYAAACELLNNCAEDQQSDYTSFYYGTHPITNTPMPLLAVKRGNSQFQFHVSEQGNSAETSGVP